MDEKRAHHIAAEFRADLEDLAEIEQAASLFEAAKRRFSGLKYGAKVAETIASWHLHHCELSVAVVDGYLDGHKTAGFVAARPVFETAMTLEWLRLAFPETDERYPWLLTLTDSEFVGLARRLQSGKQHTREKAQFQYAAIMEEEKAFVDEAIAVGSRNLPGMRSRMAETERRVREQSGKRSKLTDGQLYYRLLSSYGHPTGLFPACELGDDGKMQYRADPAWDMWPVRIVAKEMPLLFFLLVELADWEDGKVLAQAFHQMTVSVQDHFDDLFRETLSDAEIERLER